MPEFHLLKDYPRSKRTEVGRVITPEMKDIAARLDFNYWDGERKQGFGGYTYDGRWRIIARAAKERYNLNSNSRVLIERCGCEKGFLVFDLKNLIPGITVYGMHCSSYPINHAMEGYGRFARIHNESALDPKVIEHQARDEVIPFLIKGDPREMPFRDDYFDTVISIDSACAYPEEECRQVVREISRVSKGRGRNSYIENDSWKTEPQRENLVGWTFLCKTFLDNNGWEKLFGEEGYNGDWGFTIIE